jgi:hypothetical protein
VKLTALTATILLSSSALYAQEQLVDASVEENSEVQLDVEQQEQADITSEDTGEEDFTFNIIEREQHIIAIAPVVQQPQRPSKVTLFDGSISLPTKERNKWVGYTTSLGFPSVVQLGLSVRPGIQWAHVDVMANYALKLGYAGSITLDPIDFGIAPTLTAEFGHIARGSVPHAKGAEIGWDYKSIMGGLEFGSRRSFRFFLRAGISWIDVSARNINNVIDNSDIVVGDTTLKARITGTFKIGYNYFF